ncbi:MAG: hypothetical protein PHS88_00465 [Candidatus Omnitrophica bacterium]|nr:hypothetical protein [Candidatus Omnitrophota bacterium]
MNIKIQWPKSEALYAFLFPQVKMDNLQLQTQGESQESFLSDGEPWVRKTFSLTFLPVRSGEGRIRAFTLGYIDPSTQKGGSFQIEDQLIKVHRKRIPKKLLNQIFAGAGTVIGLFVIAIIFFMKFGRKTDVPKHAIDLKAEAALAKFEAMVEARGGKTTKDLLQEFSVFLRNFVTEYYKVDMRHTAIPDVLEDLKALGVSRQEREFLRHLFDILSEMRFSGSGLSDSEFDGLQNEIKNYVSGKRIVQERLI